jgi:hypothetical protein
MDAFVVNDGEFYILFKRSFDDQPPHHRPFPTMHECRPTRGYCFGVPVTRPA